MKHYEIIAKNLLKKSNIIIVLMLFVLFYSCSKGNNNKQETSKIDSVSDGFPSNLAKIEVQEPNKFISKLGETKTQKINIKNTSNIIIKDISINNLKTPLFIFNNRCLGRSLVAGQSCSMDIKFSPNKIENSFQELIINYYNENNLLSSKLSIPYQSIGNGKISISKIQQLSANASISTDTKTVTLKNEGTSKAKLMSIHGLQFPLNVQNLNCRIGKIMDPGESCNFNVVYSPSSAENGTQFLQVQYKDDFEVLLTESKISYLATGKVELNFNSFPKLETEINKEVQKVIIITNNGNQAAEIIKIHPLENPLFIKNDTCSLLTSLNSGKSCEINVGFKPNSEVESMQLLNLEFRENDQILSKEIDIFYKGNLKKYPPNYTYHDGLRITSFNTMLLSSGLFPNYNMSFRADLISKAEFLKSQDIVVFQEIFDNNASDVLLGNLKKDFPYQTPVVGRTKKGWDATLGKWNNLIPEDGGVSIISKWPIEEKQQFIFKDSCGGDAFSLKGFAYTKINFNGTYYHIIGTHLQSEDSLCLSDSGGVKSRKSQINEIAKFISEKNIPQNDFVLIIGDMNIDRNNTSEYENMVNTLNVNQPKYLGVPYTFDTKNNGLAKERYSSYKSENLDYIFVTKNHNQMQNWHNLTIDPPSEQWTVFAQERTWAYTDYSDHYPVMGFAFADNSTPTKSYIPENGNYSKIKLMNLKEEKYISHNLNPSEIIKISENSFGPYTTFNISNNFSMRDNGCILTGDKIRIESTQNVGYFLGKNNNNTYNLQSGSNSALSELSIEIINKIDKCLKSGDTIML
uniref:sphingomyelin phosphodiesterase n=1 Tax=Silvanigrella sp. TaxID=2024976 RepID=UPI0037C937C0